MEKWKEIRGFDYEISDLGRVRRIGTMRLRKLGCGCRGYLQVDLYRNGKAHWRSVHRLVAKAFIPNPKGLPQVNHTGPKSDCRAIKLEWISTKEHGRDKARREQVGDGISHEQGKWRARWCPTPNVRKNIGMFNTYEEAKVARDEKIATL